MATGYDEGRLAPGTDLHGLRSAWESIEADAAADPDAALSQLVDVMAELLQRSGYAVDDAVARSGDEPEIVATYLAARETAERAELGSASRAEVETALDDIRTVFADLAD